MRFTIRDLFWLMLVVAMGTVWGIDRSRQNARMQTLKEIAGLEWVKFFPRDLEGTTAAFRNQNAILRFHVDALTRELQSRGHRVEIDGCNVFVDRPSPQFISPVNGDKVEAGH